MSKASEKRLLQSWNTRTQFAVSSHSRFKHTTTIYMKILDCIPHWVLSKFKCDLSRDTNWRKYWLFNGVEVYPKILLSDCLILPFFFYNKFSSMYNYIPYTLGNQFQNKTLFYLYICFLSFMMWKYFNQDWFSFIKEELANSSVLVCHIWLEKRKHCLSNGNNFTLNTRRER